MITTNRNIVELEEISEDITEVKELIAKINDNTTELNFILRQLTFRNLDGEIKSVEIEANSTARIPHRLGIAPAHRVILRQAGGGVIKDGEFTKNYIELTNDGASKATLTILMNKE